MNRPEFRPLPLMGNPHIQTLIGNLFNVSRLRYPTLEKCTRLADGDQLVLHDSQPPGWSPGDRIALMVHGLGGSHRSGYMQRVAKSLLAHGMRIVRLDLRGTGKGLALARKPYHGGCSDDVRAAAEEIGRWSPRSPLILLGFSLGGNIVLKLAGEAAELPVRNLARVAALAPPIDFEWCARLLAQRQNRLYERYFLRGLIQQVRQRQLLFAEERAIQFPRPMTMRLFDDLYTAPRCGFRDALHYYRSAACLPLLPRIRVPTFILTARDDPFIAVKPFEEFAPPPNVHLSIAERGGHLGFVGWSGAGSVRWAEQRIVDWVVRSPD